MFSSLLFICIFYGICLYGVLCDGGKDNIISLLKEFKIWQKWIIVGSVLFFLAIVSFWPQQNQFIYYWDMGWYWSLSVRQTDNLLTHSISENILKLWYSINADEYNIFLPIILALPLNIIGTSFAKYVVICCVMFLLPTYFVQGLLGTKILKKSTVNESSAFTISFILSVFFAGNYYAVFNGYIDVAYLLPMSVAIYLLVDYDFSKVNISKNVAIALNLVLIWICRRYTIFFVIGYVSALGIKALIYLITYKKIKNIIINFLQIGTVSLGIFFTYFKELFIRALFTNYAKMYSSYNHSLADKISSLEISFGAMAMVLIFAAGIFCFVTNKQKGNYFALLIMLVAEIFLFWRIQWMWVQHKMILNVPLFAIILMMFNAWNIKTIHGKFIINSVILFCFFAQIANFSKAFISGISFDNDNKIFSAKYYPFVRNDIKALEFLTDELNRLTQGTDDKIYVTAASFVLNYTILRNVYAPKTFNAVPNMVNTSEVDLRDGFSREFLAAKYIVTADPVQWHLKGQYIVRYLAEQVQKEESHIGKHYKLLEQVDLKDNVVAKIYEKISEYSQDDLQKISDYFTNLYPEHTKLFADRILFK